MKRTLIAIMCLAVVLVLSGCTPGLITVSGGRGYPMPGYYEPIIGKSVYEAPPRRHWREYPPDCVYEVIPPPYFDDECD